MECQTLQLSFIVAEKIHILTKKRDVCMINTVYLCTHVERICNCDPEHRQLQRITFLDTHIL